MAKAFAVSLEWKWRKFVKWNGLWCRWRAMTFAFSDCDFLIEWNLVFSSDLIWRRNVFFIVPLNWPGFRHRLTSQFFNSKWAASSTYPSIQATSLDLNASIEFSARPFIDNLFNFRLSLDCVVRSYCELFSIHERAHFKKLLLCEMSKVEQNPFKSRLYKSSETNFIYQWFLVVPTEITSISNYFKTDHPEQWIRVCLSF